MGRRGDQKLKSDKLKRVASGPVESAMWRTPSRIFLCCLFEQRAEV